MSATLGQTNNTSTSSTPLKIPTVPGFTPINTDLARERSFLRELCTKVANHWTSTFHSSRHLDNLEKVAQFSPKLNAQIAAWTALVPSDDRTPVGNMIATVGGTVGTLIKKGAEEALATIDKFNKGLKDITGYELSTLSGDKRRELSTEQRAKVSALYTSLKGDLTKGEEKFNQIGTELNGVSTAVSALLKKDAEITADLKQKETALASTEINTLAPSLVTILNNIYSQNQTKIFGKLTESANAGPDATTITAAATVATTELEKTQEAMNSIVASVNAAVETVQENKKIRDRLKDSQVPQEGLTVVTVAQATFDAVNEWFTKKADAAESAIKTTFRDTTSENLPASDEATKTFAKNSKEYRDTVQAIGKAILPFDTLVNKTTEETLALFKTTVGDLKAIVEQATVDILNKSDSPEVTMGKLQKLQVLSAKIAEGLKDQLTSPDGLTEDERADFISKMGSAVKDIITPNRFSELFNN